MSSVSDQSESGSSEHEQTNRTEEEEEIIHPNNSTADKTNTNSLENTKDNYNNKLTENEAKENTGKKVSLREEHNDALSMKAAKSRVSKRSRMSKRSKRSRRSRKPEEFKIFLGGLPGDTDKGKFYFHFRIGGFQMNF